MKGFFVIDILCVKNCVVVGLELSGVKRELYKFVLTSEIILASKSNHVTPSSANESVHICVLSTQPFIQLLLMIYGNLSLFST
jgi:hypothetical protein